MDEPDGEASVDRPALLDGEDLDDVASLEDCVPHGSEGKEPPRAPARERGPGRAEPEGRVGLRGKLEHRDDEVAADEVSVVDEDEAARSAGDAGGEAKPDGWLSGARRGERLRAAERVSPAGGPERTGGAERGAREADEGAQLHQRLVVLRGAPAVQEGLGRPGDGGAGGARPAIAWNRLHPREDPRDVAVDDGDRGAEGERRDGRGRVRTDAGERAELLDCARYAPSALGHEARGAVEVARPGVVAEAAPGREELPLAGGSERLDRREALEEGLETRRPHGDGRLLEDRLGKPDRPRVARPAKRQVAAVLPEPAPEGRTEGRGKRPGPLAVRSAHRLLSRGACGGG